MDAIYVWWDRNFERRFQLTLHSALNSVMKTGEDYSDRFEISTMGNFSVSETEDYGSADWYFRTSWNPQRKQTNANLILGKCEKEPWQSQHKHLEVIGTSYDLWAGVSDNNFVHGLTRRQVGTVVSHNRFSRWYGGEDELAFLVLSLHEIAHVFDAPNRTTTASRTYGGYHCNYADCALVQVDVGGRPDSLTAARNIARRFHRTGNYFCSDCTVDIVRGKQRILQI